MKRRHPRISTLIAALSFAQIGLAQSSSDGMSYGITALIVVAVLLLILVIVQVADNLLRIEAKQAGVDGKSNYSIFPSLNEIFRPKLPEYAADKAVHYVDKGHDILLEGIAESEISSDVQAKTFAVIPPNFIGMSPIPKVLVEEGAQVKAGEILFFDKKRPDIKYAAPVSGEVISVERGAKRSIAKVIILADGEQTSKDFEAIDLMESSREAIVNHLLEAGLWPMINQRPFDIVPEPSEVPRDIFISTFDTAPLAPDMNLVVAGREAAFQKGLDALNRLTDGFVYLGLNGGADSEPSAAFTEATGVKKHWFAGKHPAGNVGTQIHTIDPINAGERVWTLGVQEVISIGTLFSENRYDASRVIAVVGPMVKEPKYYHTYLGAQLEPFVNDNLLEDNVRFIAGDVLTGAQKDKSDYLDYHTDMVTVLKEGDDYELFGWLVPIAPRPTVSGTFPNFLYPDLKFNATTNTHGEKRAFVQTGVYESLTPMDIHVQHLMKAILVNDYERMEGIGIYEMSEEDVALAEFACSSKQPLQQILRQGLDLMRES